MSLLFNDTATTEIYTLSLHDALPISAPRHPPQSALARGGDVLRIRQPGRWRPGVEHQRRALEVVDPGIERAAVRSEEHTSELQSRQYLVCRLLLEKKNTSPIHHTPSP